jgi:hypothetical protein
MIDGDKIKTLLDATHQNAIEGLHSGMSDGDVATVILAYGVGLHMRTRGIPATIHALHKQADKLEKVG